MILFSSFVWKSIRTYFREEILCQGLVIEAFMFIKLNSYYHLILYQDSQQTVLNVINVIESIQSTAL